MPITMLSLNKVSGNLLTGRAFIILSGIQAMNLPEFIFTG